MEWRGHVCGREMILFSHYIYIALHSWPCAYSSSTVGPILDSVELQLEGARLFYCGKTPWPIVLLLTNVALPRPRSSLWDVRRQQSLLGFEVRLLGTSSSVAGPLLRRIMDQELWTWCLYNLYNHYPMIPVWMWVCRFGSVCLRLWDDALSYLSGSFGSLIICLILDDQLGAFGFIVQIYFLHWEQNIVWL